MQTYRPGNVAGLADEIIRLVEAPALRHTLGEQSFAYEQGRGGYGSSPRKDLCEARYLSQEWMTLPCAYYKLFKSHSGAERRRLPTNSVRT